MNDLNNREIAIAIWGFMFLCWTISRKDMRSSLYGLYDQALESPLSRLFALSAFYSLVVVLILNKIDLWSFGQLKNTLVWFFSIATISIGRAIQAKESSHLVRLLITDNLKIIVVLEFIIGFYPMSLFVELVFFPISALITVLVVSTERKKEHELVYRFFNGVAILLGLFLLVRAFYQLSSNFDDFTKISTLSNFTIHPLLSLFYFPFTYVIYLFVRYEQAFLRMTYLINNKDILKRANFVVIKNFNFKVLQLKEWLKFLVTEDINLIRDLNESINLYKDCYKKSKHPPEVSIHDGWSPFLARNFLKDEGLITDLYHPISDGEWCANSEYVNFGISSLSNSISFFLLGNKDVVTKQKITLMLDYPENEDEAILMFNRSMADLILKSNLRPQSGATEDLYDIKVGSETRFDFAIIRLSKRGSKGSGYYEIVFEIIHDKHIDLYS